MLHQIFRTLVHPSVTRASYPAGQALRPLPNCFVRYRKRPWSPLAPTKLFRVKERQPQHPQEYAELRILHTHYKTTMKALRVYFQEELAAKEAKLTGQTQLDVDEQHHVWCIEQNEKFNQESAALRAEREARDAHEREEKEFQKLMELEEQKKKQSEHAAEHVRKIKMHAADFISVDKLDSAIEAALDSRCVYNFAIDVKGNRYIEQPDGNIVISPPPSSEQHELTSGS